MNYEKLYKEALEKAREYKQEDKELLLKDLSARLPYGVVVETQLVNAPRAKYPVLKVLQSHMLCDFMQTIKNIIHKPYLRPMSSMTEEEKKDFIKVAGYEITESINGRHYEYYLNDCCVGTVDNPTCNYEACDWLNANLFDYRGLIPKGLAIEVTEDNNPYKTINLWEYI